MTKKTTEEDVIKKYLKDMVIFNIVCLVIIFLIIIVFFNNYRIFIYPILLGLAVAYISRLQTDIFACNRNFENFKLNLKYS